MNAKFVLILLLAFTSVGRADDCDSSLLREPFTPRMDFWWSPTAFEVTPRIEQFLATGASRVNFARREHLTIPEQLRLVVDHVRAHVNYDGHCALSAPETFDLVLANRRGACVQMNLLTAALLSRAGFHARIVYREPTEGMGHLWVEVGEGAQAWVVDATQDRLVVSMATLIKSKPGPNSFEAQWFMHPDRVFSDLIPEVSERAPFIVGDSTSGIKSERSIRVAIHRNVVPLTTQNR